MADPRVIGDNTTSDDDVQASLDRILQHAGRDAGVPDELPVVPLPAAPPRRAVQQKPPGVDPEVPPEGLRTSPSAPRPPVDAPIPSVTEPPVVRAPEADRASVSSAHSGLNLTPSKMGQMHGAYDEASDIVDSQRRPFQTNPELAVVRGQIDSLSKPEEYADPKAIKVPGYRPAPTRDWQAEMNAARTKSDRMRAIVGMMDAAHGLNEDLNGIRKPTSWLNSMSNEAERPEAEVQQDMQMDTLARKRRAEQDVLDPNSRTNRMAQQAFMVAMPKSITDRVGLDAVKQMTKPELDEITRGLAGRDARDQAKALKLLEARTNEAKLQAADNKEQTESDDKTLQRKNDLTKTFVQGGNEADKTSASNYRANVQAGMHRDDQADKNLKEFHKETAPVAAQIDGLKQIDEATGGAFLRGDNVPLSRMQQMLDKAGMRGALNEQTRMIMSGLDMTQIEKQHELFGARLTDTEVGALHKAMQNGAFDDPQLQFKVLRNWYRQAQRKMTNSQAVFKPLVEDRAPGKWQRAEQQGMPTAENNNRPLPAIPTPTGGSGQGGTVIVRRKSDGKAKRMSAADAQKFSGNPDYEVTGG